MSTHRYPGGIINASAPTVTSGSASGVWTVEEAVRYKSAGTWPDGAGTDPYFRNTTLLLHGDGTNGAQNNTFLDSSTNNFTITRNGNTTQGSFDPYVGPGCWSDFYAATSSGWQTPASSVNNILGSAFNSTATFTAEAWIYPLSRHSGGGAVLGYVLGSMQLAGGSVDWSFGPDSNGNLVVFWYQGGNQICKGASVIPLNTWTHIAMSVSAGAIKLFVNGVQETTTGPSSITLSTQNVTYVSSGGYLYAGTTWQGFNGYVSNLRVIGKRAVYTSTFTPSTTPLVATTDTTLLVNNSASLVDQSASNWTLTATGSVQISKFSPFSLYQITPASYSGYFDGTGDYLSLPTSAGLQLGSSDFTFETWVYFSDVSSDRPIVYWNANSTGNAALHVRVIGTKWALWMSTNGSTWAIQQNTLGSTVLSGQWYHVAVVRSSTNVKMYINGSDVTAGGYTLSGSLMTTYTLNQIGVYNTSSYYLLGSLSNLRLTNTVVYSSNFTPPTSPLTAISGTSLLTCQSTTFIDNSTNAFTITANGNATPKIANPFTDTVSGPTAYATSGDGGSGYFDGTGDYLSTPSSAAFSFGTGDFTVECWFNLSSLGVYRRIWWFSDDNDNTNINASNQVQFGGASQTAITGSTISANTWYHLAYVRSSGSGKLYLNGAQIGSTTANSYNSSSRSIYIGATSTGTNPFIGYISDLRVVKGTAVYTGPFVPPASPVTAITNTQLLLNMTNGGIFDSSTVNNLETGGAAQISTATVKYGTGSISYNGSTSYLVMKGGAGQFNGASVNGSGIFFAGNTFTLECWIYPTTKVSAAGYLSMILGDANTTSGTALYWGIGLNSSGQASVSWYDGVSKSCSGSTVISNNTWTYIAFVVAAGVVKIYVNGTSETLTGTTTITTPSGSLGTLSSGVDRAQYWAGFLDDLRLTSGVARYSTNFTPPTGPFPNI